MEAPPPAQGDAPPPRGRGWLGRLLTLALVAAGAGIGLGSLAARLGVGVRPLPPVVRLKAPLPPTPSADAPTPEPETPGDLAELRLRSLTPLGRQRATGLTELLLELPRPRTLALRLRRAQGEPQLLAAATEAGTTLRAWIPLLPPGERARLEAWTLDQPPEVRTFRVVGRPAPDEELLPPTPGLEDFRVVPGGLVTREGERGMAWYPRGGTPRRVTTAEPLAGRPLLQRGRLIGRTRAGTLLAHDVESGAQAWVYRGPGPLAVDPVPVAASGLLPLVHAARAGGSALEHLEGSTGIPMWRRPLRLPRPAAPGPPCGPGGAWTLLPLDPEGVLRVDVFTGAALAVGGLPPGVGLSGACAQAPDGRRAALGSIQGAVLWVEGGEARLLPAVAAAVEALSFLDADRLLVATGRELMSLNRAGARLWKRALPAPRVRGPAARGGRLFVEVQGGELLILAARDGELLERRSLPGPLLPGSLPVGAGEPVPWGGPSQGLRVYRDGGAPAVEGVESGPLAPPEGLFEAADALLEEIDRTSP